MPATKDQLFALLNSLSVAHSTVSHPRFYTVEEGRAWDDKIPGLHCKNLFLKNKKGALWLVVLPAEKRADLGALEKKLGSGRLSFGKPDLLQATLGIPPGSVTPFAIMNDAACRVQVVLDADILEAPQMSCHPLENDASTTLAPKDLLLFLNHFAHTPLIFDCGPEKKSEKAA
jgi:Ala-tRNA(Pro) deacylase